MKRLWSLGTVLALPLGFTLLVLALCAGAGGQVWAAANIRCVNHTGTGCSAVCGGGCYASLQSAVDAAAAGNEIRVAGGTYTHPGGTVAAISKGLQIVGGYDPSGEFQDPDLYSTVLDGGGNGSVISITNAGEVTLFRLTLTHGDGTGNCDYSIYKLGCGGGIYAQNTTLHVLQCLIVDNVASDALGVAMGGGIYAVDSLVEVRDSQILSNTAGTAAADSYGDGGGILIQRGEADLVHNEIRYNVGSYDVSGSGGIELLDVGYARVMSNTIENNQSAQTGNYWSSGGGLQLQYVDYADVIANHIEGNGCSGACYGGGIYVWDSSAHLARNVIIGNNDGAYTGHGAGVSILGTLPVTMSNNLIADNEPGVGSSAVYVEGRSPECEARLYNNTIADNGSYGIYGYLEGSMLLINNVIAGHSEGIHTQLPFTGTIAADTNLFWNQSDLIVGAHAIQQDPHLLLDGHPTIGSPAVNAGLDIPWLVVDLEGHPRPREERWDLGAFEGEWGGVYLPLVAKSLSGQ